MSVKISSLKIAFRNVWLSLSVPKLRNFLASDRTFQQVFLSQLAIYNFLFETLKGEGVSESQTPSVSDEKEAQLDEMCNMIDFSMKVNNVLNFLEKFNSTTKRNCVVKDLVVRSVDDDDIVDDLNFFGVFVNNSFQFDINTLTAASLRTLLNSTVELNDVKDGDVSVDDQINVASLPSQSDFVNIGRQSWINKQTDALLVREIMENKIYIYISKPKSIIVLKYFGILVLCLTSLVNLFLAGIAIYLLLNDKSVSTFNQVIQVLFCFLMAYCFGQQGFNLFMSIKGNRKNYASFFSRSSSFADSQNPKRNKCVNNDNIKFHFDWFLILFYALLSVFVVSSVISAYFNQSTISTAQGIVEFVVAVSYTVVYSLIGLLVLLALFINPKKDVGYLTQRRNQIYQEVKSKIDDANNGAADMK